MLLPEIGAHGPASIHARRGNVCISCHPHHRARPSLQTPIRVGDGCIELHARLRFCYAGLDQHSKQPSTFTSQQQRHQGGPENNSSGRAGPGLSAQPGKVWAPKPQPLGSPFSSSSQAQPPFSPRRYEDDSTPPVTSWQHRAFSARPAAATGGSYRSGDIREERSLPAFGRPNSPRLGAAESGGRGGGYGAPASTLQKVCAGSRAWGTAPTFTCCIQASNQLFFRCSGCGPPSRATAARARTHTLQNTKNQLKTPVAPSPAGHVRGRLPQPPLQATP